jgi:hypothetical protein
MLSESMLFAEEEKLLSNIPIYENDDYDTWDYHYELSRHPDSKIDKVRKLVWADKVQKNSTWNISEDELPQWRKMVMETERCPCYESLLFFANGKNQLPHGKFKYKDYFIPSIDHIVPKWLFKKYNPNGPLDGDPDCIDNYKIVSVKYNRLLNNGFYNADDTAKFFFTTMEHKNLIKDNQIKEKIERMKNIWFES